MLREDVEGVQLSCVDGVSPAVLMPQHREGVTEGGLHSTNDLIPF